MQGSLTGTRRGARPTRQLPGNDSTRCAGRTDGVLLRRRLPRDDHDLATPSNCCPHKSRVAATWLALGFDADRSVLYRQSDLPEVCELAWILSCVTPKGLVEPGPRVQGSGAGQRGSWARRRRRREHGPLRLPPRMAADILIYSAGVVPVGLDHQQQHVEMTVISRQAFNAQYGEVFVLPRPPFRRRRSATITGTDGRKMSKSYDNVVPILSPPDELRRAVMSIVTDSRAPNEPKDPGKCNVLTLYRHVAPADDVANVALAQYREGAIGYREGQGAALRRIDQEFRAPDAVRRAHGDPQRSIRVLERGATRDGTTIDNARRPGFRQHQAPRRSSLAREFRSAKIATESRRRGGSG